MMYVFVCVLLVAAAHPDIQLFFEVSAATARPVSFLFLKAKRAPLRWQ
jgi:hypothetical protein